MSDCIHAVDTTSIAIPFGGVSWVVSIGEAIQIAEAILSAAAPHDARALRLCGAVAHSDRVWASLDGVDAAVALPISTVVAP